MRRMGEAALRHAGCWRETSARGHHRRSGAKAKLKRVLELANKMGARYTLILGDNEIAAGRIRAEEMASGEQTSSPAEELLQHDFGMHAIATCRELDEQWQTYNSIFSATSAARTRAVNCARPMPANARCSWAGSTAAATGRSHLHSPARPRRRYADRLPRCVEPEVHGRAEEMRSEYVIAVEGTVELRSPRP